MVKELRVTNTMGGDKEVFSSAEAGKVTLYVCGITPYDKPHLGHGRVYVVFDVLYRLLRFSGYDVQYCRNFTDIDDKLLTKAEKIYGDKQRYREIADSCIASFHEDMRKLNCLSPTYEPRVTENIPAIIAFVEGLIAAGKAYVVDGDVYFSIASFPEYGRLSRQKIEDLRAGERVAVRDAKRDPLDFALWKSEPEGTFWKSPWGYGRPGWHIECSVLAKKYLGETIDIHAGGMDLIFPHHENERAQSEGLHGVPFSRYWIHNAFVRIDKEKMSKSLGNFFTLDETFEHTDPMVVRYYILTHHYRVPLDFSKQGLESVEKSYRRLIRTFSLATCDDTMTDQVIMQLPVVQKMLTFLLDDLNTPGALGVLFDSLDAIKENHQELCGVKLFLQRVLGLTLAPLVEKEVEITPEIQALIDQRAQARKDKDWARADALRDELLKRGVSLQDKKIG